ncbi:tRNA pseudouridine32 synthase / 23S rRNA pseudouridine746 synthase [Rhodococcus triatomae]|uniref:RNA pseudouridylate synthase n=2 Tax=Rhodococcus triatomae TaxID=300028 RepID=A0A1G8P6G0_9NOCA|nr:tRNA pseudouridine32 synthase / 23S rRNA pseudouridine746 synthase [Rhodococcus triatomae]
MPAAGQEAGVPDTVTEFLLATFPDARDEWLARIDNGEIVDEHGRAVDRDTRYMPTRFVYFYRQPPPEVPVPFPVGVIHRDETLVVADKPHFLATIPRGAHVLETALVRLRRDLDLPDLVPAHRLDRMTAGVIVFVVRPEHRRPYQELFASRQVHKEYEAIAPHDPSVAFPRTVRSRIVKEHGVLTGREEPGEPNSETRIELVEHRAGRGRYRLIPETGRTHQLRLHLCSLGLPIEGDNFYPRFRRVPGNEFTDPLQLLARRLAFTDPVTGRERDFRSSRTLNW